jgi:hypothetical protein
MTSKDKAKHIQASLLLKQEDDSGYFSYKRQYITELRERYLVSKVGVANLLWPIIICIFIGAMFNNDFVWAACLIFLFITIIVMSTKMHRKYIANEEKYIRREFDMTYGNGKYDETMKKLNPKKNILK